MAALEADPTLLAACSAVVVHDEHGNQMETWRPPRDYVAPRAWTRCHRLLWTLGETYPMFGVFRREALSPAAPMGRYLGADRVLLASVTMRGGFYVDPSPASVTEACMASTVGLARIDAAQPGLSP